MEFIPNFTSSIPFPEDMDKSIVHMDATLSIDLYNDLDLDVTLQWDRINDPQAQASGAIPDEDDFRLTVGVGWEF